VSKFRKSTPVNWEAAATAAIRSSSCGGWGAAGKIARQPNGRQTSGPSSTSCASHRGSWYFCGLLPVAKPSSRSRCSTRPGSPTRAPARSAQPAPSVGHAELPPSHRLSRGQTPQVRNRATAHCRRRGACIGEPPDCLFLAHQEAGTRLGPRYPPHDGSAPPKTVPAAAPRPGVRV
jgi:hypothetical protein